jgi:hypothetical protein
MVRLMRLKQLSARHGEAARHFRTAEPTNLRHGVPLFVHKLVGAVPNNLGGDPDHPEPET